MSLVDEINQISDRVFELEQETERLKAELQVKNREPDDRDEFIRLMEPYVSAQESKFDVLTEDMRELVGAYRKAKGKAAINID